MGTGKTYVALAYLSLLNGPVVVVAPLSVLRSWEKQILEHTTATYALASGSKSSKIDALHKDVDIVLINYDFFSILPKNNNCKFYRFETVVLDESTRIKSPKANRTATILREFTSTKYKLLLTGNPIPRSYEDLFTQWLFLDDGKSLGTNYFLFQRKYFSPVSYGAGRTSWEPNSRTGGSIAGKIAGSYFYRQKSECVDLPPKIYERRHYSLQGAQLKYYKQILNDWLAETSGGERVVNNALSRDIALRQICSGYLGDGQGGSTEVFKSLKYSTLVETLEDIGDEQCVIWFWFRQECESIREALRPVHGEVAYVHGGVDREARSRALESFECGRSRIILAQQQTCAYGINELAKSEFSIYVGHTYDYDLRSQSEDRTSRIGSQRSCTYIDIVAEKSIEEAILEVLSTKANLPAHVFKDHVRVLLNEWSTV
jgi:SNF2 family DNA or RNA helicase